MLQPLTQSHSQLYIPSYQCKSHSGTEPHLIHKDTQAHDSACHSIKGVQKFTVSTFKCTTPAYPSRLYANNPTKLSKGTPLLANNQGLGSQVAGYQGANNHAYYSTLLQVTTSQRGEASNNSQHACGQGQLQLNPTGVGVHWHSVVDRYQGTQK